MRRKRAKKVTKFDSQRAKIRVGQSASATNNQGGNSIAINAVEIGVVRLNPGQQGG